MPNFINNPFLGGGSGGNQEIPKATTSVEGIVKFAEHNEVSALEAVQANDPRLNKEVVKSSTPPQDTNVIWINSVNNTINYYANNNWISIDQDTFFTTLKDTPNDYVGNKGKFVRVKDTEDGLEFSDVDIVTDFKSLTDTPNSFVGQGGKVVIVDNDEKKLTFKDYVANTINKFTDLPDTPSTFSGSAGKVLRVNNTQTALEFVENSFVNLKDTPNSLANSAGKILQVNSASNALELVELKTGIENLDNFSTMDLKESVNRRYVTDDEKNKLTQLTSITQEQQNLQNRIMNIENIIPTDASQQNKISTMNDIKTAVDAVTFLSLPDTPNALVPNSYLYTNKNGEFEFKQTLENVISLIIDKNGDEFNEVEEITFKKLKGTSTGEGKLTLTPEISSLDISNFPKSFENNYGYVLVANSDNYTYEHKHIDELTFSRSNKVFEIHPNDWAYDEESNKYIYNIEHLLDSTNLILAFYDENNLNCIMSYKIIDNYNVVIHSGTGDYVKVVINASLGSASPEYIDIDYSRINAIDDINVRVDKTFSSSKITDLLSEYARKQNVYTKTEADLKYAAKFAEHAHPNISTLNKFSEDQNGLLMWNNKRILTTVEPYFYQELFNDEVRETLDLLIDTNDIYSKFNYTTIVNSEILIKNNKMIDPNNTPDDDLKLVIVDGNITIIDVDLKPQERQKYILGISPNIKIYVRGSFEAKYYLGAF